MTLVVWTPLSQAIDRKSTQLQEDIQERGSFAYIVNDGRGRIEKSWLYKRAQKKLAELDQKIEASSKDILYHIESLQIYEEAVANGAPERIAHANNQERWYGRYSAGGLQDQSANLADVFGAVRLAKFALSLSGKVLSRFAAKGAGIFQPAKEFYCNASGNSYRTFQRTDIDWNFVRTAGDRRARGLTNAEAGEKFGLSPQLPDGHFATLHHSQQNALGPFFEASTRYHNIRNINKAPLHPHGTTGHPFHPMGRGAGSPRQIFQDFEVKEYWMWRAITR